VQCPHPSGSAWCEQYGYDRYGNRWVADFTGLTQQAVTPRGESWFNPYFNAGQPSTWNRAETNRILFNQYDNAGNQTSAGGAAFSYDAENRQTSVLLTAPQSGLFGYTYDGDGFRVKRFVYGMETVYFHDAFGRVVTEYRNGQWFKDYVYLGGQLLAVENAQGRSYVTTDHLGSTRIVTDSSGNVHSRHDYLPFGKEVPPDLASRADIAGYMVSGWSPAHRVSEAVLQRFTGQEVDPETGLEHFMFRYYSGRQGRFTSVDPVPGEASDPQSLNGYAYVLNNPLLYTDPLGLAYWWYGDCLFRTTYTTYFVPDGQFTVSHDSRVWCRVRPLGRTNPDDPPRSGRGGLAPAGAPEDEQAESADPCAGIGFGSGIILVRTPKGQVSVKFNPEGHLVGLSMQLSGEYPLVLPNVVIPPNTLVGVELNSSNSISFGFSNPVRFSQGVLRQAYLQTATFSAGRFTEVRGAVAPLGIPLGRKSTPSRPLLDMLNGMPGAADFGQSLLNDANRISGKITCRDLF